MRRLVWLAVVAALFIMAGPVLSEQQWAEMDKDKLIKSLFGNDFRTNPNRTTVWVVGNKTLIQEDKGTESDSSVLYAGAMGQVHKYDGTPVATTHKIMIDEVRGQTQTEVAYGAEGEVCIIMPYLSQFWLKEGDLPASRSNAFCALASGEMAAAWAQRREPSHKNVMAMVKYIRAHFPKHNEQATTYEELVAALKAVCGITAVQKRLTYNQMCKELLAGRPVITDVDYGVLSERYDKGYTQRHVLVICGVTKTHVITMDPDDPTLRGWGKFMKYPKAEFLQALGKENKNYVIGFDRMAQPTVKTEPSRYDTHVNIDNCKYTFEYPTKGNILVLLKEFELTNKDLAQAKKAVATLWIKCPAGNRVSATFNRKVRASKVSTAAKDWQKCQFTFNPNFLYVGRNLFEFEIEVKNVQRSYDFAIEVITLDLESSKQ